MGNIFGGSMLTGMVGDVKIVPNLISHFIDRTTMKALFENCLRFDIADNNMKAEALSLCSVCRKNYICNYWRRSAAFLFFSDMCGRKTPCKRKPLY